MVTQNYTIDFNLTGPEITQQAQHFVKIYKCGGMDRETLKTVLEPYFQWLEAKGKEIAKKYGRSFKRPTFASFIR